MAIADAISRRDTGKPVDIHVIMPPCRQRNFGIGTELVSDDLNLSETWIPADSNARDAPSETRPTVPRMSGVVDEAIPEAIGRYAIEDVLGTGGYGRVYLAKDTELQRRVALKVPHAFAMESAEAVERFLAEAQTVASLDHSGVVPIYDFGRWEDRCFVVSKFIDGETLYQRHQRSPLTVREAVRLIRKVAETLGYIHSSGVIHRDIKPGNLLLDEDDNCFVTDFGLALRDFEIGREPGQMGTISFMSPEQARGESHLVDGRSDLFSLGIVMYELLTGARPFTGQNWQAVIVMICYHEPKPPRQRVSSIPRELERICLKLLAKKPNDRYATAADLVEDLNYFLESSTQQTGAITLPRKPPTTDASWSTQDLIGIIPRGLRSFSREDAQFFRQLLPGTRDREGVPDSVRFWQQKIESRDPDDSFRLGVIYGPSGSGKSSFVKAGLVPTLPDRMNVVFVEAAAGKTEERLTNRIHSQCPETAELGLRDSMAQVRNGPHALGQPGVLIVIDQFEQWLHGWDESPDAELAVALRQCDGDRLRTILLVRDDFWLALSRFADVVDFELVPGFNLSMVDLFDRRHARRVLAEYGRGHARLPETLQDLSKTQNAFLDEAIDGLATGDKIVPIQLAAFSEIMKGRDWDTKSLHEIGGVKGVGVRFLDESFSAVGAPANQRSHEVAVQGVLKTLLPDADTNIKGAMRSSADLQKAAGYEGQAKRFEQLIQILDSDLRLITPADSSPDAPSVDSNGEGEGQRFYQLTHDFLVPAVRTWLERRQSLTIRGRAALRLADRTEVWTARPDKRHLPSWLEWISLLLFTRRSQRDVNQQKMMSAASGRHSLLTLLVVTLALSAGLLSRHFVRKLQTAGQIEQLMTAAPNDVIPIVNRLNDSQKWSRPQLFSVINSANSSASDQLRASIAILRQQPLNTDAQQVVEANLDNISIDMLPSLVAVASPSAPATWNNLLWDQLAEPDANAAKKLRALLLLAAFDPPAASKEMWDANGDGMGRLVLSRIAEVPSDYSVVTELIRPATSLLLPQLATVFRNPDSLIPEKKSAAALASSLLFDRPQQLADLLLDSGDSLVPVMREKLASEANTLAPFLEEVLATFPNESMSEMEMDRVGNRQANAAILLLSKDPSADVFHLLSHSRIPVARTNLIGRLAGMSLSTDTICQRISTSADPGQQSALLMVLAERSKVRLTALEQQRCIATASRQFEENESAEVHSAAAWMLRRFSAESKLGQLRQRALNDAFGDRQWKETPYGTFVQLAEGEHSFAICTTEVTMEQFLQFRPDHGFTPEKAPSLKCPAMQLDWDDAVEFCIWLTLQTGLGDEDQCYERDAESGSYQVRPDYQSRRGFRLPTPPEWKLACLGNVATRHFYGVDHERNTTYSLNYANSEFPDRPVSVVASFRPGLFGTFDMTGNVSEWCSPLRPGVNERRRSHRPIRGGAISSASDDLVRLTTQGTIAKGTQFHSVGLRLTYSNLSAR